jgi:hypothetical protein
MADGGTSLHSLSSAAFITVTAESNFQYTHRPCVLEQTRCIADSGLGYDPAGPGIALRAWEGKLRRRDFITLLAGTAVWPLVARAAA